MILKKLFLLSLLCLLTLLSVYALSKTIIYEEYIEVVPVISERDKQICYPKFINNVTLDKKVISEEIEVCNIIKEKYVSGSKEVIKETTKRIGLIYDNHIYLNKNGVNIEDNKLIKWVVPVGDRNYIEFGKCSKTEINRGVCSETQI